MNQSHSGKIFCNRGKLLVSFLCVVAESWNLGIFMGITMRNIIFLLCLMVFALPSLLFGDGADDDFFDDDSTDPPNCVDICDKVELCGTDCILEDCLTLCEQVLTSKHNTCLGYDECRLFDSCLCVSDWGQGGDDDAVNEGCGGCGVSKNGSGVILTLVMFAIGILALFLSAKKAKQGE